MKFVLSSKNKSKVCKVVGISRSTVYYKKKKSTEDPFEKRVIEIFREHNGNYGAPRIKILLERENEIISRRRIGKILKKNNLESKHGRKKLAKNIHTSTEEKFIAENLIKGYIPTESNRVCQMDASQFKYQGGKLFVTGILDVFDKTVVASYGNGETKKLVSEAIEAKLKTGIPGILHSDRGSANSSKRVKKLLEENKINQSMSAPYKPNENQYVETFWKTMKIEVGETEHLTKEQLIMVLDYYLHYYNTERIHSSIGYITPAQMRELSLGYPRET